MAEDDDDCGDAAMGNEQQLRPQQEEEEEEDDDDDDDDEEDEEFLDGSHSLKISAGPHLDQHHHRQHDEQLLQPDSNRVEHYLLSGPISTPETPAPASAISKELLQVEVELRLLEALEIYHPAKLQGIHRHFILYGLMEYLERRLNHHFSADEILELLDRFYNLDLLKPDEDESDLLSQEEEFSLPASILSIKEELKETP